MRAVPRIVVALLLSLTAFASAQPAAQAQSQSQSPSSGDAPAQGPAQAPPVIVRTSLRPATGAVLGQHVAVYVDVLFRSQMSRPPRVSIPDVPGAQIMRFETQATTMSDTIDGETYVGQRFEFALYPRRGGDLTVPAAAVTLLDSTGAEVGSASGPAITAAIAVPPGVDQAKPLIASRSVTLQESWQPRPASFKVGDALVRTLVRSADDVPGLAMQDLDTTAPPGVRAYAEPPQMEDQVERGSVTGERRDKITYVFERPGSYALPAASQLWWDLGQSRLREAAGEPIEVIVSAAAEASTPRQWGGMGWRAMLALGASAVLLMVLTTLALRWIRRRAAVARERWNHSERKAFDDLVQACRSGAPPAIYQALGTWVSRLSAPQRPPAAIAAPALEQRLFRGDTAPWTSADGAQLIARLRQVRAGLRADSPADAPDLPPLNPQRALA